MRKSSEINIDNLKDFKEQVLLKSKDYSHACILDSGEINTALQKDKYEFLAALGCSEKLEVSRHSFHALDEFQKHQKDWIFGAMTYEIKNELDLSLMQENASTVVFPHLFFFKPITVVLVLKENPGKAIVLSLDEGFTLESKKPLGIPTNKLESPNFKSNFTKEEYINTVEEIKERIEEGLYYELNLCQEFKASGVSIDPIQLYKKMSQSNPVPFGAYLSWGCKYLLCSSPERFLRKEGLLVTSQPIKGTARRGETELEDTTLRIDLFNNEKERAENVMIVDLVRNDLSKTCKTGTVEVEELFGIHSYRYVHQMISTIIGEITSHSETINSIKNAFPMGSMTGAPKLEVIKNIDTLEKSARGLYSGSVGYIDPKGNFDFNVVIRSLIYKEDEEKLSYHVGGAITYDSQPEKEYEECLLKAKGITSLFD